MRKICTFTQTYGNDRSDLYKYHNLDYLDIKFRNNFDLNLYAFHNSSQSYIEKLINTNTYFKKLNNLQVITYNNISYTETFRQTLEILISNGFDYIIFLQDDCLTIDTSKNIDELVFFIKNGDFNMLNLETHIDDLRCVSDIFYEKNSLNIYNTNSEDFKNRGWFAFDDGAYVGNIKYILDNIYDSNYFSIGNIWSAEGYLNSKIGNNLIQRLTSNNNLYERYNIVGPNNWDKINLFEKLDRNFNKINYVVISSDDNPLYKDFYPVVAKRWYDIGLKTYYINVTNTDSIEINEWGIVHKIKAVDFISTGFQSQVARLYASNLVSGNLLMSDIDMLPINGDYFFQIASELNNENVIIYSGQPYGNVPYYPMCYVLSHSSNFQKYLEIENMNFSYYCKMLLEKYNEAWNTDENFMYDKFQNYLDKLVVKNDRDFSRRVDRSNWNYDIDALKNGYYIDSHMLRPYLDNKNKIDNFLNYLQ